ncbi:hypothetical protein CYMTET_48712 [Cymbomonas tetramitiformis]|uniref:AP2/ERF domain-containing protein n=1 Tax=Cymbomonas tetramitiformis TaxID=36881 RepID=A0AAE0BRN3_9CHLO|nr:hypothetical protein CYMTET_48712 [Cymbomonas tetramitiformis]
MPPKKAPAAPVEKDIVPRGIYKNQGLWRTRIFERDGEIYVGHFESKEEAARAYDKACLKHRGVKWANDFGLNYEVRDYEADIEMFKDMTMEEVVLSLRKQGKLALAPEVVKATKFK